MLSLILLQITAPLCFIFAIKRKMYKTNMVGFVVIGSICFSLVLSKFVENWEEKHYVLITVLLLWIVAYNTYKHYRNWRCSC